MTINEIKRQMFIDSEEVCGNTMIDTYQAQEYVEQAYNKAIDDLLGGMNQITYNCQDADELFEKICDLAEQLKAGGENVQKK